MCDSKKFACLVCKFSTRTNYCLEVHFATKKHIRNTQPHIICIDKTHRCKNCNNQYKYASGLYAHIKKCVDVKKKEDILSNDALLNNVLSNTSVLDELKKLNERIDALSNEVSLIQLVPTNVNNITTIHNNNFKINVFLNETCKNAINLDCFIKNLMFELADPKLMIGNYVDGTCNILQRNLDELPLNKRPLHCMEGEDPNQQLMHIRQDNKWNVGTYVNWLEQIHADDDDAVVEKNPIYYALKTIDDEKLKYLGYNFYQDVDYKLQHGRLNREVVRQDLKKDVYKRLLKIITLDTNKLIQ